MDINYHYPGKLYFVPRNPTPLYKRIIRIWSHWEQLVNNNLINHESVAALDAHCTGTVVHASDNPILLSTQFTRYSYSDNCKVYLCSLIYGAPV